MDAQTVQALMLSQTVAIWIIAVFCVIFTVVLCIVLVYTIKTLQKLHEIISNIEKEFIDFKMKITDAAEKINNSFAKLEAATAGFKTFFNIICALIPFRKNKTSEPEEQNENTAKHGFFSGIAEGLNIFKKSKK